jgi:hypothetical protein
MTPATIHSIDICDVVTKSGPERVKQHMIEMFMSKLPVM